MLHLTTEDGNAFVKVGAPSEGSSIAKQVVKAGQ